jgi:hypothetical protein
MATWLNIEHGDDMNKVLLHVACLFLLLASHAPAKVQAEEKCEFFPSDFLNYLSLNVHT